MCRVQTVALIIPAHAPAPTSCRPGLRDGKAASIVSHFRSAVFLLEGESCFFALVMLKGHRRGRLGRDNTRLHLRQAGSSVAAAGTAPTRFVRRSVIKYKNGLFSHCVDKLGAWWVPCTPESHGFERLADCSNGRAFELFESQSFSHPQAREPTARPIRADRARSTSREQCSFFLLQWCIFCIG